MAKAKIITKMKGLNLLNRASNKPLMKLKKI